MLQVVPKKYQDVTIVDHEGYPPYIRESSGNVIVKNWILFDNSYVVPYNPQLMLQYQAHINMEWCNQCTSIKYLFNYINEGYDEIVASMALNKNSNPIPLEDVDEIK